MKYTKIQWCHSTINPEMGCDGCELWKSAAAIAAIMLTMLILLTKKPKATLRQAIARAVGDRKTSELYRDRERVFNFVQQRSDQHLQSTRGQTQAHKAHDQFQRQAQPPHLGLLGGVGCEFDSNTRTASILAKQLLSGRKRSARTTGDVVQT
jgi:hypothetical protein